MDERARQHAGVVVDAEKCAWLGQLLGSAQVPKDQEETALPGLEATSVPNFYFFLVAICHQTSPLGKPPLSGIIGERLLRGWDFLLAKFEAACRADQSWTKPEHWRQTSGRELGSIFRDSGGQLNLSDVAGRSSLIRDLGEELLRRGMSDVSGIYETCSGRVVSGTPNLVHELSGFRAYADPVLKKTVFFLSIMRNTGLWDFQDGDLLVAPVDYHEIRGHLRIGTVRIDNEAIRRGLDRGQLGQEEDVVVRLAVQKAISAVAQVAGITPSRTHYLFWNLFRSVCVRSQPMCFSTDDRLAISPRYAHLVDAETGCPFRARCASAGNSNPVVEPAVDTDFY